MKQEAEQFRQWKASREKELLQVHITFFFLLKSFVDIFFQNSQSLLDSNFTFYYNTVTERREKERV
jgi:hypothetical protein